MKVKLLAAATSHSACWADLPPPEINVISDSDVDSDIECTRWNGGVSHIISDSEDSEDGYLTVEDFGGGDNYDGDFEEITGDEIIIGLQKEWQKKLELEQLAMSVKM